MQRLLEGSHYHMKSIKANAKNTNFCGKLTKREDYSTKLSRDVGSWHRSWLQQFFPQAFSLDGELILSHFAKFQQEWSEMRLQLVYVPLLSFVEIYLTDLIISVRTRPKHNKALSITDVVVLRVLRAFPAGFTTRLRLSWKARLLQISP